MIKIKIKVMMIASAFSMISFSFFSQAIFAQNAIAPDNTLPVNTSVNFNSANQTYTITGGTQVGGNQFHSFQDFSVPTSNTAHFDTAPTTVNAIGRVTGSNISNIDGILRTNGTTNLYLVNPNGIVFGANAKLDIAGSFSASTANSIKFSDGSEFSATNPQAPPLLNVNVPLGLQYGNSNAGATISNSGNLSAGQDLVLNADRLDLQGALQAGRDLTLQAQDLVKIRDTSTSPFFAVAGRDLLIQGNQLVDIFTLNHRSSGFWSGGNMLLRSQNPVIGDAHFYAGKNLKIEKLNGSLGNLISPNDPVILANGDVFLGDYTGASLHILAGGSVTLGNVTINSTGAVATTINPNNTTLFNATNTYADLATYRGALGAPSITIDGSQQATLDVRAGVDWSQLGGLSTNQVLGTFLAPNTDPTYAAPSNANITINGNIRVSQPNGLVLLTNQFVPNALTGTISARGIDTSTNLAGVNGGDIRVDGRGDIEIDNASLRSSAGVVANAGNGGAISLSTNNGTISLTNSNLDSGASAQNNAGNGGAISLLATNGNISLANSSLKSSTLAETNARNGGGISLLATNGNISLTNSSLDARTTVRENAGNGGAISLLVTNGSISLVNSSLDSYSFAFSSSGNGGAISFAVLNGNISLTNSFLSSYQKSFIYTGFLDKAAGEISLSSSNGDIKLFRSSLNSSAQYGKGGKTTLISNGGGDIILDNSQLNSFSSPGIGGAIAFSSNTGKIMLSQSILDSGSSLPSFSSAPIGGSGGDISFSSNIGNITLENSSLRLSNVASGEAGSLSFNSVSGSINLVNSSLSASASSFNAVVSGGTIFSKTEFGNITIENTKLDTFSANQNSAGDGGAISFISGFGNIQLNNSVFSSFSYSGTRSAGNAGDIFLSAANGNITSSLLSSLLSYALSIEVFGSGIGGKVTLAAKNQISNLEVFTISSSGQAGMVKINGSGDLVISNLQVITSKTVSIPNIQAPNDPDIIVPAEFKENGRSGDVAIANTVGSLTLDQTTINSTTQSKDPAGNISVTSPSFVTVQNNSKIISNTQNIGNAGNVSVKADQGITFKNNSQLSATTSGQGKAGNITFTTKQLTLSDGVLVSASTSGKGKAGDIFVRADDFTISNGAQIQTATTSIGDSGTIDVRVVNQFNLSGSKTGLFANTLANSTGRGGDIFIDPESVTLRDGAQIAVGSLGAGIGGNITLISNFLTLLNGSSITAETASANGGNITLSIPSVLLLRYGSQISTTAGTSLAGGNGGNINITAGFIVALPKENSDIFANAFTGNGGNINLTTNGIFGLEFRPVLTPLSDITASSAFGVNGTVNINTPGVDPSKGLTNLPVDIGDASKLVSQKCLADRQDSAFVITGRGGIPASPADVISGNNLQENLGAPNNPERIAETTRKTINPYGEVAVTESLQTLPTPSWARQLQSNQTHDLPDRIVEAQGWTINPYGEVSLVAEVPKAIAAPTWARQLQCR